MSPAAAQTMLDDGFGIDVIESTKLGTLYNKNGLWQSGAGQTEQSLAYFLPRDMELVVFANSPIGAPGQFFRDVVTNIYLDNIAPEIPVGGWIARHGLTAEQYQEAFNDYVGNHGMQLMDVSGYGDAQPLYAALWVKTASAPAWQARHGLTAADYQTTFNQLTAAGLLSCARERLRHRRRPALRLHLPERRDRSLGRSSRPHCRAVSGRLQPVRGRRLHARLGQRLLRRHPGSLGGFEVTS